MSEIRKECSECLNYNECFSGAAYNSIYCIANRKYKVKTTEDNKCLHCGTGEPKYCESCYQELIGKYTKLQHENTENYIHKSIIEKQLAEAELKLKNYKAARGNNKPIQTHIKIIKLISEIEIYKGLLGEEK